MNRTKRTEFRRLPGRGSHDLNTVNAILDAGFLAHVGFCVDGQPFVIPTLYGRDGKKLYLHGSAASRMLGTLETGIPRLHNRNPCGWPGLGSVRLPSFHELPV